MSMLIDELLDYLFDGRPHVLLQPMAAWLAASRRFAAFVATFREKIRKKIRTTKDHEGLLDLRLELETAYLLLRERNLSVDYEPEQSRRIRSPDFAVTFTTSLTFMVEVTRVRADPKESEEAGAPAVSPIGERLADAIASKLGQLLPERSNVLLVGVESLNFTTGEVRAAMLDIQKRAERNDSSFLKGHRFRDRADFFRHYKCLSEVLVRPPRLEVANSVVTWINPQAKHPLPGKVRTVLYRSHA